MGNGKTITIKERLAVVETEIKNLIEVQRGTSKKIDQIWEAIGDLKSFKDRINGETKATAKIWSGITITISIVISIFGAVMTYLKVTGRF